jgi:hypothetical protein
MPITVNQKKNGGYVVIRATANESYNLNTLQASGETIQSASISEIMWSVDGTNNWTVRRGTGDANNVAILAGSGHHDYQASGMRLEQTDAQLTGNVQVVLSGGNGYISVKLHKVSGE